MESAHCEQIRTEETGFITYAENHRARAFYEHLGGEAEAARPERGPGGALLQEVAYRWPDIGRLF